MIRKSILLTIEMGQMLVCWKQAHFVVMVHNSDNRVIETVTFPPVPNVFSGDEVIFVILS